MLIRLLTMCTGTRQLDYTGLLQVAAKKLENSSWITLVSKHQYKLSGELFLQQHASYSPVTTTVWYMVSPAAVFPMRRDQENEKAVLTVEQY